MPLFLRLFKRFVSLLRRENLHQILLGAGAVVFLGGLGFYVFEKQVGLWDALWWAVVTATTVGYGDISPATPAGRVIGVAVMLVGIGFVGLLTATIAGIVIENRLRKNRGLGAVKVSNHYLICGWNYKGPDLVAEIRADAKSRTAPIVVLAELNEKPPVDDPDFHFVRGEVHEETLKRANAAEARAAVVLADEKLEPQARDAMSILSTLTIKTLYPSLYTCVELVDPKNIDHCRRAHADEIIVGGELCTNLLAQAVLDPGVTQVVTELVSNRYGQALYKVAPPSDLVGRPFLEILGALKKNYGALCVAVERRGRGMLETNPDPDRVLREDDRLLVIARERPSWS